MTMKYKFDELLEFPCIIDFRIIIDAKKENALPDLCAYINSLYKDSVQPLKDKPRHSSSGTYISYTVPIKVEDAAAVENLYAKISKLDYVKHII
ncbi:Uncharacterized conserved protein [Anaerobiospirillum thomasii]|uniref:Uncharacterized conserved protein n=2 Tax=Anaerobiospirillum thomasii TaxID=179995 RepID=A0A2X0WH63_9GAMM|nr:Uncharacterized conserved protein [Anaerobiospirillum thomasii]